MTGTRSPVVPAGGFEQRESIHTRPSPSGATAAERGRSAQSFAIAVTAAFLAVVIPVALHHEMWRDEVQAWLLARDTSLAGLFQALHYEGHPSLWYLILRVLTPLSADVRTIQIVSVCFGAATVYLFALRAPLTRFVRVLFAFGYFVAYGYTVVARSYSLEMFLMVLVCIFVTGTGSRRSRVLLGIVLLLLANTSLYGVIVVLALIGAMLIRAMLAGPDMPLVDVPSEMEAVRSRSTFGPRIRAIFIPLAFAVLGICLAFAQVWPRADTPYLGNGALTRAVSGLPPRHISFAYRLTPMWRAFVPIPPTDELGDVWEGDMLLHRSPRTEPVAAVLSIMIVVVLLAVLARSPLAATFFGLATLGTLLFSMLVFAGSLYHHGHFFVAFMMALWIAAADPGWRVARPGESRIIGWVAQRRMQIVSVMLLVQIAGSAIRLVDDYRYPFSEAKAVADFVTAHMPAATIVASEPGFNGTPVSAYLGRPVYELDRARFATFTPLWFRWPAIPDSQLVARVRDCCARAGAPAVLLLDHALAPALPQPPLIAKFVTSMQPSERYFVYRVDASADADVFMHLPKLNRITTATAFPARSISGVVRSKHFAGQDF